MLKIYFGLLPEAIEVPPVYFDTAYEDDWMMDPFTAEMLADIDKSQVIGPNLVINEVLGPIPPTMISGGVKTLMLIKNRPDIIFNATSCGDNCAKWLLKIGEMMDVTVCLEYPMEFPRVDMNILVLNDNSIAKTWKDITIAELKFVR